MLWVDVATKRVTIFLPNQTDLYQNTPVKQHCQLKTLSASTLSYLRAVGAETTSRSMCFLQVHSHLPDREDVNVLDCIKFCDQFSRQNHCNFQTNALIRRTHLTLHVSLPFMSDSEQGNKKNVQKFRYEIFEFRSGTTVNVISQRQVKIEQRPLAHLSPRFMGVPHTFTC